MQKMIANRPFRLSTRQRAGLDGRGALVAKGSEVTILERPKWNTSLALVAAAGDEGLVKLEWLDR